MIKPAFLTVVVLVPLVIATGALFRLGWWVPGAIGVICIVLTFFWIRRARIDGQAEEAGDQSDQPTTVPTD
jgi:membrane-bound ClpP family serine protease